MGPQDRDARSPLTRWLSGHLGGDWGIDPTQADPQLLRTLHRSMSRLFGPGRYFRLEVAGWERLPPPPVLLVSNHSGGSTMLDAWGLWIAWHRHFGFERMVHSLGHEILFSTNVTGRLLASIGSVRASHDNAERVLSHHRRDLLVLPGGDRDTWRPWRDRYTVHFAGRKGYAKLAIKAGVPIVPVAHAGAHGSFVVLTDGHRLASAMGMQRLARAAILPVHLSAPFGLTVGPWPHLPLPRKLRYRIGDPIAVPAANGDEPSAAQVDALDLEVRTALQAQLDHLAGGSRLQRT
jgi:1-acyl-sn-glycerol-3-phosphate acyltransferase